MNENRKSQTCKGCGDWKDYGNVVCWGCFKSGVDGYRQHKGITIPYKYFGYVEGETEEDNLNRWLAAIGRAPVECGT